ncbi:MAG: hypothetical protein J3Q66DRAFT_443350 [Benniella sp.]|nr:MAG: hypothetical protein J3Q66DRAFT_443350 [Benniella sp.]
MVPDASIVQTVPYLQIDHLILPISFIKTDDIFKVVTDYLVPRARHLQIGITTYGPDISPSKTKHLLSYCSSTVEELTFQAEISCSEEEAEYHQTESRPWTQLKRLNLLSHQSLDVSGFWEWLWKRCGTVQELEVEYVEGIRQSLVEGIAAHMPHLNKIRFESPTREDTEAILSLRHQGWKEVTIGISDFPQFPIHLMMYSAALERLAFVAVYGITDRDIVQLLACCPNLRGFVYHGLSPDNGQSGGIDAQFFIDQDHDSGSLKPWICETSLRELEIRIQGIPRPDVKESKVIEDYPGHGREIQQQVYDRLARFINLETFRLGGSRLYPETCCLEMSLESGLDRISGLKELKELDVSFMRTWIGEEEVKWMVKHWSKLCVIYGLRRLKRDREAVKWLQRHHPEILMEELW